MPDPDALVRPDPGNSPPDAWTEPLSEEEASRVRARREERARRKADAERAQEAGGSS